MSTVASQSISDLPLEITYVSLVLYTLEPPKLIKDTLGLLQNQSIGPLFRGCPLLGGCTYYCSCSNLKFWEHTCCPLLRGFT